MPGPGSYWIGEEEKKEVQEVLDSRYLFRYGKLGDPNFKHKVYDLEQNFASYCGSNYALATTSGSASLLVSLFALGIKPGDEIIVPTYTFVASYTSIIFFGAVPVLAEIDESLTIDAEYIVRRITPKTKAIMPVHMLGNPANMDAILAVSKKYGIPVIEDACQCLGASYHQKKIGTLGQIGAFSLNFFKTITSGDGGLMVTNDKELYERAFGFHDQGHLPNRSGVEVGNRKLLGVNFRMNELTGAVALAQLRKLVPLVHRLREIKGKLKLQIDSVPNGKYRTIHEGAEECATILTVLFDTPEIAAAVAEKLGTVTVSRSGWHVYSNMEHVGAYLESVGQPHGKGAYPKTDNLLSRAVNISVGVVDGGLGAGFGINIESTDEDIARAAKVFLEACMI